MHGMRHHAIRACNASPRLALLTCDACRMLDTPYVTLLYMNTSNAAKNQNSGHQQVCCKHTAMECRGCRATSAPGEAYTTILILILINHHACYHAANERAGYLEDAQRDLKNIQLWSQELKAQLCDELKFSAGAPMIFRGCCQALVMISSGT